jgi:hypothetical protein
MQRVPRFDWFARTGYAARGIVFIILSYFTGVAAVDAHARAVDSKDALRALLTQPFGRALLLAVAVGLLCFGLWREMQGFLDADHSGNDAKALVHRGVFGAAGLFYIAFASVALSMAFGGSSGSTERTVHDWTGWLLRKPMGPWLIGLAGISIVIGGLCVGVAGLRAEFRGRLEVAQKPRWFLTLLGCLGYLTRAVVIVMIGSFLIFSALHSNAREATGVAGALQTIKAQPYGAILLWLTALGFFAFGAYGIAEAAFRRIDRAPVGPIRKTRYAGASAAME